MKKNKNTKKIKSKQKPSESLPMTTAEVVIRAARPNFLLLTMAILLMTFAVTYFVQGAISTEKGVLVVLAAILAHLAVNWLNEVQDFTSGLDLLTQKTPFSGGSGALPAQPEALKWVKIAAYISLIGVVVIGAVLVWQTGMLLFWIGLLGLMIIITYTKFITKQPWLCLISPGLAFGPIMVIGSYFVLTGEFNLMVVCLSFVPFFLVNNLLLLNQIPDIEADKKVGRYNVSMLLGLEDGIQLFAAFIWLTFITLGVVYWWFELPSFVALGFASLLIVFPMLRKLQLEYSNPDKLMPVLTMNVIITILTPSLIGVGFIVS